MGDDSHPEWPGALGDLLADPAQTGDAKRLAAKLVSEKALLFPAAVFHGAIGGRDEARQRQHERERMLGDADAVGARGVDHEDAAGAGGRDVDVVHAGAGPGHNPQLRRGVEQPGVHLRGASDHQRVGVGEIGGQHSGRAAGTGIDHPAGFGAEQIERGHREVVGNDNFQCVGIVSVCRVHVRRPRRDTVRRQVITI